MLFELLVQNQATNRRMHPSRTWNYYPETFLKISIHRAQVKITNFCALESVKFGGFNIIYYICNRNIYLVKHKNQEHPSKPQKREPNE